MALLLISTILLSFSFLSNVSNGYALVDSKTDELGEGSSYFLINYNGEDHKVVINEEISLQLTGWADEAKSTVNSTISDPTNQVKEVSLKVSDELNKVSISESESIYYRISVSDTFKVDKVNSLKLSEQNTVIENNENGTFIEEGKIVDEYGTVIESKGLSYYSTDESNQKVLITEEEYESLNTPVETPAEDTAVENNSVEEDSAVKATSIEKQQIDGEVETSSPVLMKRTSLAVQSDTTTTSKKPSVVYSTHVQGNGWLDSVSNGKLSGTSGESKRLEAIKIDLKDKPYNGDKPFTGDITYTTHVQSIGWLEKVSNGALSGTSGKSKRLEAIQINLTGEMAEHYDVYYRVHAQTYGWLDWAKNGKSAGTEALSKRLEAIEIVLVEKGGAAPGSTNKPFVIDPSVVYSTHVQGFGWLKSVSDGKLSGTSGKSKRLEAIKISLDNTPYSGDIIYKTHVQGEGWMNNVSNGNLSGTSGKSKRLEAIQISLTGEMSELYDVYYRVHAQSYGWLDWAKNGQSAGTAGLSKRLEAIEIVLVEKGGPAPGATNIPLVIDPSVVYSTHVQGKGWLDAVSDGIMSGTSGESKRLEAIKISLEKKPYSGGITYTTHVQGSGWLNHVSNGALSGTSGKSKRLEAIQINLTGEMAQHYDIYYRVHAQSYGWLDWAKNGQSAGTARLSKRLEGIEIVLVKKGGAAPGSTTKPFIQPNLVISNNHYNLSLSDALTMQMKVSPQTDLYRNDPAYVSGKYLEMFDGGSISGTEVNLRTSPDLDTDDNIAFSKVGYGTDFLVLDKTVKGDSFKDSTTWYKIDYKDQELYVHSSLANINSRVGKVTATNLMIRAEKNATSHLYGTAKKDTLLTVLEEDNSGWYRVSIGNWRNAKAPDVQAYLDPTKFIKDEKQRLQFMNLTESSEVSVETLNQFLSGKGSLANKGQKFINASKEYGINEVYLIAHAILETGRGTSPLAQGVKYNGKTVYNMFGFGAKDACPIECGAKTAYENEWFSEDAAIKGGAAKIKADYISDTTQNTLYEMRWNPQLMATNGRAGHQYATDIGWATKQVNIMYEVYKFEPYSVYLEIPVYK